MTSTQSSRGGGTGGVTTTSTSSGGNGGGTTFTVNVNGEERQYSASSGVLVVYGPDDIAAAYWEKCTAPEEDVMIAMM